MLSEKVAKQIIESGSFTSTDMEMLIETLVSKLTREEFLALDVILDGTELEFNDAIRRKAIKLDPEAFEEFTLVNELTGEEIKL